MQDLPLVAEIVDDRNPTPPVPSSRQVLLVLSTIGCLLLLCGSGCGGFSYYMIWSIGTEEANRVAAKYASHPDVMREIGEIQVCKPNLGAKFIDDPDEDWDSIYDVVGANGKGQFMVYELFGLHIRVQLRTANGKWELIEVKEKDIEDASEGGAMDSEPKAAFTPSDGPHMDQQDPSSSREILLVPVNE